MVWCIHTHNSSAWVKKTFEQERGAKGRWAQPTPTTRPRPAIAAPYRFTGAKPGTWQTSEEEEAILSRNPLFSLLSLSLSLSLFPYLLIIAPSVRLTEARQTVR